MIAEKDNSAHHFLNLNRLFKWGIGLLFDHVIGESIRQFGKPFIDENSHFALKCKD
jgi:hypothetical protein